MDLGYLVDILIVLAGSGFIWKLWPRAEKVAPIVETILQEPKTKRQERIERIKARRRALREAKK